MAVHNVMKSITYLVEHGRESFQAAATPVLLSQEDVLYLIADPGRNECNVSK
jgi:hypothetical protein